MFRAAEQEGGGSRRSPRGSADTRSPPARLKKLIQQIRLSREQEQNIFARLGESSPTQCRHTDVEGYEILRDLRERTGGSFRALHMRYRPSPESPSLRSDERRKIKRLLNSPTMRTYRSELEAMLTLIERVSLNKKAWDFRRLHGRFTGTCKSQT